MQTLDREKMKHCITLSTEDMEYLTANYDELARKYDKKWIIISDKKVVSAAESLKEVVNALKKIRHPECAVVEYMTTEPIAMFF